jgi:hypothetical protein
MPPELALQNVLYYLFIIKGNSLFTKDLEILMASPSYQDHVLTIGKRKGN